VNQGVGPTPEDLALYESAKKCKNVLEIGSWRGRSNHALLSWCKGTVTAVDTWQGSSDPGDFTYSLAKKSDVFAEFQKNVGHFPNLEVLRMSSAEAAKVCESRKFDMVFIDATHTYEGVCDDIKAWKDNAALILAGHDFTQTWIGVQRAVRDSIGEPDEVVDTIWVHRAKDSKGRLFTIWLGDPPPPAIQKCIDSQKIPGYGHKVLGLEECPKVSILLPTLGRPEGLQRCLESIDRLYYPKHLIEVLIDDNPVASVPIKVNRLMRQATGEVFVYAANDMEFTPESLYRAVKSSSGQGSVAFNTGELLPDKGNINEHFLIWRTTVEKIGGVIFNERFHHAGCDNLLWALCERIGEASRCEEAVVRHYHFSRGAVMDEVYRRGWNQVEKDRAVLKEELAKLEAM